MLNFSAAESLMGITAIDCWQNDTGRVCFIAKLDWQQFLLRGSFSQD
jgi:hypothetical protein